MSDILRAKAWTDLAEAAIRYAEGRTKEAGQALSEAAKAWAAAAGAPVAKATTGDGPTIPFGKSKGVPLSQATPRDLQWVAGALRKSIDDPEKARWRDSNKALLASIEAELATR